ncbi:MAG TPA: trypsin-like peptidase domain-containing protein [Candidatus Udaeobacter sp.]|jgi:hypothetical protein
MFQDAVRTISEFTRPISFITRYYDSTEVQPGSATLFFVNADGWALTCRHVLDEILAADQIATRRAAFQKDLAAIKGKRSRNAVKQVAKRRQFDSHPVLEHLYRFQACVDTLTGFDFHRHDKCDVALLRLKGYSKLLCSQFPTFAASGADIQQGKTLCRVGFPFPEFSNFAYNKTKDQIEWTTTGSTNLPRFPIDGMVSRLLVDGSATVGFELTTPGLRGQSGGPAFDHEARIWGMQSETWHLDLNFDVAQDVFRQGKKKKVTSFSFLHVGRCVHVDVLKQFMRKHGVSFIEG